MKKTKKKKAARIVASKETWEWKITDSETGKLVFSEKRVYHTRSDKARMDIFTYPKASYIIG